jgi:predicted alpha-1,6-mannanase (GH76 family)
VDQFRAWAGDAVDALQRWYNPRTGLWRTAGWWNSANALTAVIQHSQQTGEDRYRHVVETTFGRAGRGSGGFSNEYYDDDGWWALAWIAAFDLTGEARYLDLARALFAGMAAGWDSACGGGLWWTRRKTYKNAIPNELFLLIAGRLHQRAPGAGDYLGWARREWQWFRASGLIGPAGLVNDGLTADCRNNGGTTWTYNQGVIIGALAVLAEITGDDAHLDQAEAIAAAALRDLSVPPGILTEPGEDRTARGDRDRPQFKGIFVRHLSELRQYRPRPAYRDFILANATSLWRNSRNHRNQVGLSWTGPFDRPDAVRQTSALDALNAALAVAEPPADPPDNQ